MDPRNLKELLERVRAGTLSTADAAEQLAELPYEDLGFAKTGLRLRSRHPPRARRGP